MSVLGPSICSPKRGTAHT